MDDIPVYQYGASRKIFGSENSVTSNRRIRGATKSMTRDKIHRWITFRMKFNKDFLTEMFSSQEKHISNDMTSRPIIANHMSDPNARRLGDMLRSKYSTSDAGLHGNSYFVFGLPRVRTINEEFYRIVDPDFESESIAEGTPFFGKTKTKNDNESTMDNDNENMYAKSIKRKSASEEDPLSSRHDGVKPSDEPLLRDRIASTKRENIYGDYIRPDNYDRGADPGNLGRSRRDRDDMQWRQIESSARAGDPRSNQFFFKGLEG